MVFTAVTRMPAASGVTSPRTLGTILTQSTWNRLLASWFANEKMPRGRWYLKLRPSVISPAAASALEIVSPAKPLNARPSNSNASSRDRSIHSPGTGGRRYIMSPALAGSSAAS